MRIPPVIAALGASAALNLALGYAVHHYRDHAANTVKQCEADKALMAGRFERASQKAKADALAAELARQVESEAAQARLRAELAAARVDAEKAKNSLQAALQAARDQDETNCMATPIPDVLADGLRDYASRVRASDADR